MLCEIQSVSSRIWNLVAMSISYDDYHYTTGTSFLPIYLSAFMHVCMYVCIYVSIYLLNETAQYTKLILPNKRVRWNPLFTLLLVAWWFVFKRWKFYALKKWRTDLSFDLFDRIFNTQPTDALQCTTSPKSLKKNVNLSWHFGVAPNV